MTQTPLPESTPPDGWLARFFKPLPGRLSRREARKWRIFAALYLICHAVVLGGMIWLPTGIWVYPAFVYILGLPLTLYFYFSLLMPVLMSLKQLWLGDFSYLDLVFFLPLFLFVLGYFRFVFDLIYVLSFFLTAYMTYEVRKIKMKNAPAAQDPDKQKTA